MGATALTPAFSEQAFAQTVDSNQEASNGSGLDQIIVSGRRREENLQDTPIAISAFTAEKLEQRQISSTEDLDFITPSLQFKTSGQLSGNSSAAVVFIRGVGQIDPTAAVDPGVGVYIDEVYVGRSVGGAIDFGDIASVEVLRGPQGTLFGRNTIGGAILIRSKEPEFDRVKGTGKLRIGDDNLVEAFAALNVPLSDTLAVRGSVGLRKREGYVTRVFDGLDLGDDDTYTLKASLKWEPTDSFNFLLRADYTDENENGSPFVFAGINESAAVAAIVSVAAGCPGATIPFAPVAPGDVRFGAPNVPNINDPRCANDFQDLGPFVNGGTAPVESTLNVWGVSATAEWDASETVTLKSITAYRSTDSRGIRDADNTPFEILTTDVGSASTQFSQELQAQFDFDSITGLVGAYYFDEKTDDRVSAFLSFPPAPPFIASILAGGPGTRDLQVVNLRTESFALFSEWDYEIVENLNLSGGLRYTEDKKSFQGTIFNIFPSTNPDPSPLPTQAIPDGGPLFVFPDKFSDTFTAVTGTARLSYRWTDNVNTYLSYGRSFKSGGFNTRYNSPPPGNLPISFGEETVTSYELGAKIDLTNSLRVNLAGFLSDYQDIQLIFRQGVVPILFNAGTASINGFEAEFTFQPNQDFILEGGFSILDAKIKSVTPIPGATATITQNSKLPLTPSFQGNFGIGYTFHPSARYSITPRFDGSYTASHFFDVGNTSLVAQNDGYFYGSASITLEDEDEDADWRLRFGFQNVTDELFLQQGNASLATLGYAEAIYARPRSWFLEVSKNF
ncbi:MAG: TonB-dependent receptor [Alphaproteobacteria bacterium]|nr:MAG: TonB-dependent receptor [Alphaproteobacteria bacterium]